MNAPANGPGHGGHDVDGVTAADEEDLVRCGFDHRDRVRWLWQLITALEIWKLCVGWWIVVRVRFAVTLCGRSSRSNFQNGGLLLTLGQLGQFKIRNCLSNY